MADFILVGPGSTQNPFIPANVIVPKSTLKADTNGWRASATSTYACFAHNVTYGNIIVVTATVGSGATSNGDDMLFGIIIRTGANAGGGIVIVVGAFSTSLGILDTSGTETPIGGGQSCTRGNADVWSAQFVLSGGTWTVSNVTQNAGTPFNYGANTTTTYAAESSLAAGGGFEPFNNNSLYMSQFTGTGVAGGGLNISPTVGSETMAGNAPTVTPAANTVLTPFVARKDSGVMVPDRRILMPTRKIFLPSYRKAA